MKENNKLIAEFMGFKMVVENYHGINIIEAPNKRTYDLHGLQYHKSWDWLMPVVEKIEKEFAYVNIKGCAVNISTFVETSAPTKIESVYKAVLECINLINNNHERN